MNNINPNELDKFNAMAQDWWNPQGACKPLHRLNPIRIKYLSDHVPIHGQALLDVGCGGGIFTEALARTGAHVTGLELASDVIEVARAHAVDSKLDIEYIQQDVESYASEHAGAFDVVSALEMLEHVPDPASVVQACSELVKPGGHVFFSTLNRHPMAFLQAIVGAEYLLNMVPKGTHSYGEFIKPSELEAMMSKAGLRLKHLSGLSYNPLNDRFTLSRRVWVNYFMIGVKQ